MFVGFAHTHTPSLALSLSLPLSVPLFICIWRLGETRLPALSLWHVLRHVLSGFTGRASLRLAINLLLLVMYTQRLPNCYHTHAHTNTHGRIKSGIKRVAAQVADSFGSQRRTRRRGKKEFIHILTNIYQ